MIRRVGAFVALGLLLVGPLAAQEKPKKDDFRKATEQWTGVLKDAKLKGDFKSGDVVTDAAAFEKLWKVWQPKADVPKVDFATRFVLVVVSEYEPLYLSIYDGPDKWKWSTSHASPKKVSGFGWGLGVFDRKGVTELSGKKLDAPAKDK